MATTMAPLMNFDAALVARLFRRSSIELAVSIIRTLCVVIGIASLGIMTYFFVQSRGDAATLELKLHNQLQEVLAQNEPKPISKREDRPDYTAIADRELLGKIGVKPTAAAQPTAKAATPHNLILIGTFISDSESSFAIIEDTKKSEQDAFKLKEKVFGVADLVAIRTEAVDIEFEGNIETLKIDDAPSKSAETKGGVASLGEDSFTIDEGELDKAMENLPLLLTQARAVPYFQDGKAVGLRLFAIRSGSLFEKIGLLNGDILKAINGNSLADFSQAMTLFQKLKEERSIGVTLERNKQEREFKYNIR